MMKRLPAASVPLTRRELLRAGAIGGVGLSLPELLRLQEAQAAPSRPRADACILIFLWGAPSQYETFDPKPDAPASIRGEFGVIRSAVPGTIVSEHIPLLAQRMDRLAVVRTCAQSSTHHQSAGYEALTGYPPSKDAVALTATPADHPNLGSVVARMAPGSRDRLRFVSLPQLISDVGNLTPGQFAGFLGHAHDPFAVVRDPSGPDFNIEDLTLRPEISLNRLDGRRELLSLVDRQRQHLEHSADVQALDTYRQRAVGMLTNPAVRKAFDLSQERDSLRDTYGRNSFGQSCLLARRLVESGVKLVTIYSANGGKIPQEAWDTHADNFQTLRKLLPPMDQGTSALLDDLRQRGLDERTLLVWMGEFGRTPKINAKAGRDHWSSCYSIFLAGAGTHKGLVYGQSDRIGAYPVSGRVFTPADICATIYDSLGIDYQAEVVDQLGKPMRITQGRPMVEVSRTTASRPSVKTAQLVTRHVLVTSVTPSSLRPVAVTQSTML
jgi:uncharacterized protein (DUF1501 family)